MIKATETEARRDDGWGREHGRNVHVGERGKGRLILESNLWIVELLGLGDRTLLGLRIGSGGRTHFRVRYAHTNNEFFRQWINCCFHVVSIKINKRNTLFKIKLQLPTILNVSFRKFTKINFKKIIKIFNGKFSKIN